MELTVLCYSKCTTCQKALKWLDDQGISCRVRPIKEENPNADELRRWQKISGLPLKRFFNTSGLKYKELNLKDRLPTMTEEQQLELLASDGMLVKRPILLTESNVIPGFREDSWLNAVK